MITPPFQKFHRYSIPTTSACKTHGNINEKIWVIVEKNEDNEQSAQLLLKILKAVNIDINNEACQFFVDEQGTRLGEYHAESTSRIIISFGPLPKNLGLNLTNRLYHPVNLGVNTYLFSERLSTIEANQQSKKQLWTSLQRIFNTN